MWIARDEEGWLSLYSQRPRRLDDTTGMGVIFVGGKDNWTIPSFLCPEITYENSPVEVERITIKLKEDVDSKR